MARRRKRQQLSFELTLLPRRRGILANAANPILIGRHTYVAAIGDAALRDGVVVVATQRDPSISEIGLGDLYPIGTEGVVSQTVPKSRRQPCAVSSENITERGREDNLQKEIGAAAEKWPAGGRFGRRGAGLGLD